MVGDTIKLLREKKNIYQQELADNLSVAKSTIAMWETNKRTPDADTLIRIANYFDVSVDYLIGNTDIKNPTTKDNEKNTIKIIDCAGICIEKRLTDKQIEAFKTMLNGLPNTDDL